MKKKVFREKYYANEEVKPVIEEVKTVEPVIEVAPVVEEVQPKRRGRRR